MQKKTNQPYKYEKQTFKSPNINLFALVWV